MKQHPADRPDDAPAPDAARPDAAAPSAEPKNRRQSYRKPALTTHGSLSTHTLAAPSGDLPASDRNLKEGFAAIDPGVVLAEVLGLPLTTWSYRGEPVRHLGPMAQDFHAAFGLGADDRHIHTLDATGVALAAVQGLHALVAAQARQLAALQRECADLRDRLDVRTRAGETAWPADRVAR